LAADFATGFATVLGLLLAAAAVGVAAIGNAAGALAGFGAAALFGRFGAARLGRAALVGVATFTIGAATRAEASTVSILDGTGCVLFISISCFE
jgi:hypothetical protein